MQLLGEPCRNSDVAQLGRRFGRGGSGCAFPAADSPVLTLGVEKSGLLRAASPAVHILLDIPAHGIHTELTGTVTPAAPTLTTPTSRMQDSDIASLVQLRQTVESVVQFVQGVASGTQSAS